VFDLFGSTTARLQVARVDRFVMWSLTYSMIPTLLAVLVEQNLFNWFTTIAEALPEVAERIHIGQRATTLEILCVGVSGIRNDDE
jgi:hypothetical protein